MAGSRLIRVERGSAKAVIEGFQRVQTAVVNGYGKVEDAFVERYLTREGESAVQAKIRLKEARKS